MYASRDILAAFAEISRGALSLGDYLAGFRKQLVFASFAVDDPLPAIAELPLLAWNRLTTRRQESPRLQTTKELAGGLPIGGEPSAVARSEMRTELRADLGASTNAD